jgi:hypothetical protein
MGYCLTFLPAQLIIIMYTSKVFFLSILLLAILSINSSFAQSNVKTDTLVKRRQSLVLQIGGGLSAYVAPITIKPIELPGSIKRTSVSGTVRLMWYPNYRLRLGIESGFINFYSYRIKNADVPGKVNLDAIPLLVVWSMQIVRRVNVYAGFGTYFLTTKLDYKGKVESKAFVLGSNIALSYTQPISKNFGIAAEAKWMNSFETKDYAVGLQVQMVWKFVQL